MNAENKRKEKPLPQNPVLAPSWYLPMSLVCNMSNQKKKKGDGRRQLAPATSPAPAVTLGVITTGKRLPGPHRGRHGAEDAGAAEGRDRHRWQTTRWRNHVADGAGQGAGTGVHAVVGLGPEIESTNVEPLGATVFHVSASFELAPATIHVHCLNSPPQSVLARKHAAAVVALVVALPHVHALVVPLQVRLAHKLLVAVVDRARERVLALLVVCLHVRLEVVAAAEQLAASLDLTLKVGLLLGRQAARRPPRPRHPVLPPGIVQECRRLRRRRSWVERLRLNGLELGLVPCRGRAVGEIASRGAGVGAAVRMIRSVNRPR